MGLSRIIGSKSWDCRGISAVNHGIVVEYRQWIVGFSQRIGFVSWDCHRVSAVYRGIVADYRQWIVGLLQSISSESWDCRRVSAVYRGIVAAYRQCIVGLSRISCQLRAVDNAPLSSEEHVVISACPTITCVIESAWECPRSFRTVPLNVGRVSLQLDRHTDCPHWNYRDFPCPTTTTRTVTSIRPRPSSSRYIKIHHRLQSRHAVLTWRTNKSLRG